jgi:hypothetical protein
VNTAVSTPGEYWAQGGARPHPVGCACGDSGRCEWAQLVAEERREAVGPIEEWSC